jgi:putative ABC transport system permease protein
MDAFRQDLRHGLRLLRRNPLFAATALLTVALGVGATTAVFSVIYGVLLRPLPYPEPERLVQLWTHAPKFGLPRTYVGAAMYRDWREQNDGFEELALVRHIANLNLTGEGEPERLQAARVTASLFRVLRVSPALGRTFRDEEEEIGRERVVLLSHRLWQRRFAADPAVVGRGIRLNGEPHIVVGVMGPEFRYPGREFELWTPLTIDPEDYRTRLGYDFLSIGRLKSGVSLEPAQAEMHAVASRLARQYPDTDAGIDVIVAPMLEDTVSGVRRPLYVLLGAVASLLSISCANLANLVLSRAMGRSSELVLRSALGARRGRLILQSIAEITPLVAMGGASGLLLTTWMIALAVPLLPDSMPRVEGVAIHPPVLLFALGAILITGLASGIWPALQLTRSDLTASLRESIRGTTGSLQGSRLPDVLVVAQMAIAVVLVTGAMLLVRSFVELKGVDPGFRPEGVLSLHLAIPRTKYPEDRDVAAFCRRILDEVAGVPGVAASGMVNRLPLGGVQQIGSIELENVDPRLNRLDGVDWRTVTPEYFRAIGIPLLEGRLFTELDSNPDRPVGIIDERIARLAWPHESALGKRFRIPFADLPWVAIVGIVGHIRHDSLAADTRPQVYWNYRERAQDRMALVVRTEGDPERLAAPVVAAIRGADPDQPVYDVRTLEEVVDRSVSQQWLTTTLLLLFACLALALASVGVYGLVSYSVGRRLREIGIRMALGAHRRDVTRMILRQGASITVLGGVLGVAGALLLSRWLGTLVYGVSVRDTLSFSTASVVLVLVGLAASYLPARRAARLDPIAVLRGE